jgi:hypothetical protein
VPLPHLLSGRVRHPIVSGVAFVLPLICVRKTGSAASPSRYGGRPEAGHDSRDTRLPRCEKPRITVCVRLLPGSTIGSGKRWVLLNPPPGAARLFSCPRPVRCRKGPPSALILPADNTPRYEHPFTGGPNPIGPARRGLSRRRELRIDRVLGSSPRTFSNMAA